MTHVQYFLSMANIPLTDEEYAAYPDIGGSQFVVVTQTEERMLIRGIIDPTAPFEQILSYLTATERDPQVLMVLNPDASDYAPEGEPLFPRHYNEYLAFFPPNESGDRPAQNTGGGWLLPGDVVEVIE